MPRIKFDSASDEQPKPATGSHFHRRRPLHDRLGGGKVADVLLWRNKHSSAGIVAGATFVWFLFEVAEYHFLSLMCHVSIAALLVLFTWSNLEALVHRDARRMPQLVLSEEAIRGLAFFLHAELSRLASTLLGVAYGKDLKLFLSVHQLFFAPLCTMQRAHLLHLLLPQAIASLWVVSVIGSYCSSLTLAYLGLLCVLALPALYERYEDEVDHLATRGSEDLKRFYQKLDSRILGKIPRGPVKASKSK
ncbi:Reticulon [Musa troglodytarum]|uniref:Reticulon-like protein n=1 Tax=Musa troglodytarum TaxID=320322 RepID=A0A9E7KYX1_9LILI|nr:Reticulon [Musa troglodytarum]